MLAELMRLKSCVAVAGTHGKTTTTSMVAALLDAGGFDPTVINGGIINAYGTNARLGAGDWMVVEADESDGTFLKLPADIAIVTNIDPEHLDHFKTFEAVQDAFRAFVENVPFYGFAVMCTDHPMVQALVGRIEDRRIITYGDNPQADVRLIDLDHAGGTSRFTVLFRDRDGETVHAIDDLTLPMPGRHNALNATAAIAVAHRARHRRRRDPQGARPASAASSGASPAPANGTASPSSTTTATIRSRSPPCSRPRAKSTKGQVIAVVQPHRYTRLAVAVRAVLHLLQRRRRGHRRRCLSGRRGADRRRRPRRLVAGVRAHGHRQVDPAAGARGARRHRRRAWPSPATMSSASAPATSRNGPMRCRAS